MKQNRFTKLFAAGAACALALGTALAQDSSTTTTTTAGTTGVSCDDHFDLDDGRNRDADHLLARH